MLAADPDVKFLPEKHLLLDFELDNQASYYTLEGSLKGLDESWNHGSAESKQHRHHRERSSGQGIMGGSIQETSYKDPRQVCQA